MTRKDFEILAVRSRSSTRTAKEKKNQLQDKKKDERSYQQQFPWKDQKNMIIKKGFPPSWRRHRTKPCGKNPHKEQKNGHPKNLLKKRGAGPTSTQDVRSKQIKATRS